MKRFGLLGLLALAIAGPALSQARPPSQRTGPLIITGDTSTGNVPLLKPLPRFDAPAGSLSKLLVGVTNCLNLDSLDFGGSTIGDADNAAALEKALAALPAKGGCIYGPGRRVFSRSVTFQLKNPNQSIKIIGDGQNNTEWTWPTTDGLTFQFINATATAHFRDMTFSSGTRNTKTGLTLSVPGVNSNSALGEYSDITNVTFRGSDGYAQNNNWAVALNLDNISNVNIDGSSFIGNNASLGKGVVVAGHGDDSISVVYNFSKSSWVHLDRGVEYGSYVQGMTLSQDNFTAVTNGVIVPPNSLGILSQLTIVASQFAPNPNQPGASINIQTGVNPLIISDNLFLSNGPGIQVALGVHSFSTISGNVMFSPAPNSNTGIAMGVGLSPVKVNDNAIYGFAQAINLPNTTSNASITNNNLVGNTTAIANGAASTEQNQILGNAGFQPQPPVAQAVSASPWVFSSPGWPATVCVYSGTVSQIIIDGVLVALNSGCFSLEANDNINVVYSAAPAITVARR